MTKDQIKTLLLTSDAAVEHAILALFRRQTPDEQHSSVTRHQNGRGFNAFDAESGTYFANWLKSGRHLSGRFLIRARKMSLRYVGQLVEEAEAKAAQRNALGETL